MKVRGSSRSGLGGGTKKNDVGGGNRAGSLHTKGQKMRGRCSDEGGSSGYRPSARGGKIGRKTRDVSQGTEVGRAKKKRAKKHWKKKA